MKTYFTQLFYVAKKKRRKKKDNPDKLLHFYLRQNLVLIKKITEYETTYFTYGTMVNVNSDVVGKMSTQFVGSWGIRSNEQNGTKHSHQDKFAKQINHNILKPNILTGLNLLQLFQHSRYLGMIVSGLGCRTKIPFV